MSLFRFLLVLFNNKNNSICDVPSSDIRYIVCNSAGWMSCVELCIWARKLHSLCLFIKQLLQGQESRASFEPFHCFAYDIFVRRQTKVPDMQNACCRRVSLNFIDRFILLVRVYLVDWNSFINKINNNIIEWNKHQTLGSVFKFKYSMPVPTRNHIDIRMGE